MVTVYTRNNCTACTATKAKLDHLGIKYETINVEEGDPQIAWDLVDEGFRAMPVVKTDTASWAGYKPDMIESMVR